MPVLLRSKDGRLSRNVSNFSNVRQIPIECLARLTLLQVCNTPKKCVFVRVVDSCAGCATGSKHVDLTQAAFTALADLGTGVMQVQMRQATDPDGWCVELCLLYVSAANNKCLVKAGEFVGPKSLINGRDNCPLN